jgi:hypothetical protein
MTPDDRERQRRLQRDADWAARQVYWRNRLGRLRLGVEPIEEQLERYRRVTVMVTALSVLLGVAFVSLFAAFGRPEIGAVVALVLFLPVILVAWADHAALRRRAAGYLGELKEYEESRGADAAGGDVSPPPAP